ncbi:MAG TPA: 4Fe-4S single cluster domain-containing protein [Kofleriaceae bacterium]|jgi:anaerobic ribonucleoside-triphosphate reductase activating protein|nr:4Fe-4S single cluster domain-containing protein [Kofleriaceae bacterium]
MLRVAAIVDDTRAEGPGRRWALWVQGCSIRCAGCCNPEMFDDRRGREPPHDELAARIAAARAAGVEGISLLGGEPFEQAAELAELARHARSLGMTVMVFSGYTLAALRERREAAALLALTDLLVDGPYDRTRPEPRPPVGRRWIGSANQEMHHLSAAYAPDDPQMRAANTIEIRVSKAGVLINGWPAADQLVRGPRG